MTYGETAILRRKSPANGFKRTPDQMTRLSVGFDDDQWSGIREMALRDGVSIGEIVRQLVTWGLMALEGED